MQHHFIALLTCLATAASAASPDCTATPPIALDKIEARAIVVGESHGTEQSPAFVGQLACALLKLNRPVIVALERNGAEQEALNRYLASAGQPSDVKALLSTGDWANPTQDGRSSQAVLKLIDQVRQWRQAGQRVGILAMQLDGHDIAPQAPTERRPLVGADLERFSAINDRGMADKTWMTLALSPAYTVVALAGEFHTAAGSKSRAQILATPSFADALASHIPIHIVGLRASQGGSAWNFSSKGMGEHPVLAGAQFYMADARVDSVVDLGKVTASPPAVQPQKAP